MVRIFGESVLVGDYGLTIDVETDLGLIQILTNFPRLNKWIGVKSVYTFSIHPDEKLDWIGNTELHIRDLQTFIHRLLMKVEEGVLYPKDEVTKRVIDEYRKENHDTI